MLTFETWFLITSGYYIVTARRLLIVTHQTGYTCCQLGGIFVSGYRETLARINVILWWHRLYMLLHVGHVSCVYSRRDVDRTYLSRPRWWCRERRRGTVMFSHVERVRYSPHRYTPLTPSRLFLWGVSTVEHRLLCVTINHDAWQLTKDVIELLNNPEIRCLMTNHWIQFGSSVRSVQLHWSSMRCSVETVD